MDFLAHALAWTKGEIYEGSIVTIFGLLTLASSFLLWKFGLTPNAKSLVIPLVVVGILFTGTGISLTVSNQKRLILFEQSFQQNPIEFVQSENQRVEGFQYLYTVTKVLATACFALPMLIFWFSKNQQLQALAIALVLFGGSSLVIDYFSKERGDIYLQQIEVELNQ